MNTGHENLPDEFSENATDAQAIIETAESSINALIEVYPNECSAIKRSLRIIRNHAKDILEREK